jgi:hypothetical protein
MKKLKNIVTLFIFTLSLLSIFSCSDDPPPGGRTETDPGILFTDEFGNIIGGDTTDWCLNNQNGFSFGPAFPNPTDIGVSVKLESPVTDTIRIYFIKGASDTVMFYEGIVNAGSYTFQYHDSTNQFSNSYQRLYLSSKSSASSQYCRFYGDIKFVTIGNE